jgi:sugar phosphate isomerase/epimerase
MEKTRRALRDMAEMGFEAGELEGVREPNLREVHARRRELKSLCRELGLKIINFCPVLPDIVSMDRRRRLNAADLFELGAEMSVFLGSRYVQIDSFTPPLEFRGVAPYKKAVRFNERYVVRVPSGFSWERQWDALVDGVARCKRVAKGHGLTLLMEPRVGEMISNTDAMLRLMAAVGKDGFGAVLDTGHQYGQKELLPLAVMKLGRAIKYVHASDNDSLTNEHRAIGDGSIDWDGLMLALKRVGFDGYVGVDVGNVPSIKDAYVRSRKSLERLARRHRM